VSDDLDPFASTGSLSVGLKNTGVEFTNGQSGKGVKMKAVSSN
jgi:hypothetical protein